MSKISDFFNFDNIGGKIKNLAKWSCWITIVLIWFAAPFAFIVLVSDRWTAYFCWIPLVAAIVGPVFVWVSSWTVYAFGEFVEDIHAIRNKEVTTKEGNAKQKASTKERNVKCKAEPIARHEEENEFQEIEVSDDDFIDVACPKCGEMLCFLKNEVKGICPECYTEFKIK